MNFLLFNIALFRIKLENDMGTEEFEIETKLLTTKIEPIDKDCLDYSNSLPSSQDHIDLNTAPSLEVEEITQATNPLETNETENIKTGIVHKCPVCGRCFKKRYYLTEHMPSHSDERPFECSVCLKK